MSRITTLADYIALVDTQTGECVATPPVTLRAAASALAVAAENYRRSVHRRQVDPTRGNHDASCEQLLVRAIETVGLAEQDHSDGGDDRRAAV